MCVINVRYIHCLFQSSSFAANHNVAYVARRSMVAAVVCWKHSGRKLTQRSVTVVNTQFGGKGREGHEGIMHAER